MKCMHGPLHALAFGAALVLCSLSAARAQVAGDPNDAFSCYSHCGEQRRSGSVVTCYCDSGCRARGDCCADKDTYCSVKAGAPYCSLTNNNRDPNDLGDFCGTDLGMTFVHGGRIQVLFGDSSEYDDRTGRCVDRGFLSLNNDDAQATLPLARPTWLPTTAPTTTPYRECSMGTLAMERTADRSTFQPISLLSEGGFFPIPLPVGDTPLAGFSDGVNAFAIFGQGGVDEPQRNVHIAYRQGAATNYRVLTTLANPNNFENVSAAVVTSLSNFNPPTGTGGVLLLFGRPRFNLKPGQTETNLVYLMQQQLPLRITPTGAGHAWAPSYFTGWNANGTPKWTTNPSDTVNPVKPLVPADFRVTYQHDVKWLPQISKWVMLYGGSAPNWAGIEGVQDQPRHGAIHVRFADVPWGPWTAPSPALFREKMGPYYHCDATTSMAPAGCDPPWTTGTWTQGVGTSIPGCATDMPEPLPPNLFCTDLFGQPKPQRGNLYSPNMIVPWTVNKGYSQTARTAAATVYVTTSMWFPYQVALSVLDLQISSNGTFGTGVIAQARDRNNDLIAVDATTVSNVAGSNSQSAQAATTFTIQQVASPAACSAFSGRGPAIGDTVTLRSNNGKLLNRTATGVSWIAGTSPAPAAARWLLESAGAASCAPIVYGPNTTSAWAPGTANGTAFRLRSTTSSQRLRSSGGALSLGTGTDTTYKWTFDLACRVGDNCTAVSGF